MKHKRLFILFIAVLASLLLLPPPAVDAAHDQFDRNTCNFSFETITYTGEASAPAKPTGQGFEYQEGEEYLRIVDEGNCTNRAGYEPGQDSYFYHNLDYTDRFYATSFTPMATAQIVYPAPGETDTGALVFTDIGHGSSPRFDDIEVGNTLAREKYFEDNEDRGDAEDTTDDTLDSTDPVNPEDDEGNSVTCESKGSIAWIFCPIIEAMASVADYVANNILQPFLSVDPLTTENEDSNVIYNAWGNIRTLANILLIPVFLMLIFAQALSFGMDAYSIKKALPRLVIAVAGIQLSYFVAAVMIDLFNIIGTGIGDLLLSTASFSDAPEATITVTGDLSQVFAGMGLLALLGTGGVIWAAINGFAPALVAIALMLLLPLALGVILTFFVLILRQGLITMLVAFSPLAFVAWVLPNTEKWFKQWLELFTRALFMFPLIMGFIASGKLLASMLTARIDTSAGGIPEDANAEYVLYLFAAMIALGAPLLLVPFTFKLAGSTMSMLGNLVTRAQRKGSSGVQGDARDPNSLRGSNMRKRRHNRGRAASGDRLRLDSGNTDGVKASRIPGRRGKQVSTLGSKVNRGINSATHRTMDVEAMGAQDFAEAQERVQSIAEDGNDDLLFTAAVMGSGNMSKDQLAQRLNSMGKDGKKLTEDSAMLASAKRISSDPYLKQAAHQFVGTRAQDGSQLSQLRQSISDDNTLSDQEKARSWRRVGQAVEGSNLAARYTDVNGQIDHAALAEKATTLTPQQMSVQSEEFWNGMNQARSTLGDSDPHMQQFISNLRQEQEAAAAAHQARTGQKPSPEQLRGPAGSARAQESYREFMRNA